MHGAAPIDLEHLHLLSEGDLAFEQELLQTYLADTQMHLAAAKMALKARETTVLRQEAHHLKGASGNVGASLIQSLAAQLEHLAQQGNLMAAARLTAELEVALGAIEQWLGQRKE